MASLDTLLKDVTPDRPSLNEILTDVRRPISPKKAQTKKKLRVKGSSPSVLKYASSKFIEGVALGHDIIKNDERFQTGNKKVDKIAATAGSVLGNITREAGLALAGGGLASAGIKAVPWVAKVLEASPKAATALGKYAPTLVEVAQRELTQGFGTWGLKQIIYPKENKPGVKGLPEHLITFGAGGLGGQLSKNIMIGKNLSPALEGFISGASNNVAGTVGLALGGYIDDKERFINELGPMSVANGLLDAVATVASKGKVKKVTSDVHKAAPEIPSIKVESEKPILSRDDYDTRRASLMAPEIKVVLDMEKTSDHGLNIKPDDAGIYSRDKKTIARRSDAKSGTFTHELGHLLADKSGVSKGLLSTKERRSLRNWAKENSSSVAKVLNNLSPEDQKAVKEGSKGLYWLSNEDELYRTILHDYVNDPQFSKKLETRANKSPGTMKLVEAFKNSNVKQYESLLTSYDDWLQAQTGTKVQQHVQTAQEALERALNTGSESELQQVYDSLSEASKHVDEGELEKTLQEGQDTSKSLSTTEDLEGIERAEGNPSPDDITPSKTTVLQDEIAQKIIDRKTSITKEDLETLRHSKPPEVKFNLDKLNADDGTLLTVDTVANEATDGQRVSLHETAEKAQRIIDDEEAQGIAHDLGWDIKEVREYESRNQNAPELFVKWRKKLAMSAAEINEKADNILSGLASDFDYADFVHRVNLHAEFSQHLKGAQSNLARTLSAFRIAVPAKGRIEYISGSELTPEMVKSLPDAKEKIDALIEMAGGKERIGKMAQEIKEQGDLGSITSKTKELSTSQKVWGKVVTYRAANMLGSWMTHAGNIVSQSLNAISQHAQWSLATLFSHSPWGSGEVHPGELSSRIVGDWTGILASFTRPMTTIKDVDGIPHTIQDKSIMEIALEAITDPRSTMERIEARGLTTPRTILEGAENRPVREGFYKLTDWATGELELMSFGALEAGDLPFEYAGYASEVMGRAWAAAKAQGLDGATLDQHKTDLFNQVWNYRTQALKAERSTAAEMPTAKSLGVDEDRFKIIQDLDSYSLEHAKEMTWKEDLTGFSRQVEGLFRQYPWLRLVMPFYKTPVNILREVGRSTPLTFWMSKRMMDDLTAGGKARDLAVGKILYGTTLLTLGGVLASNGMITGSAITKKQREEYQNSGIPEKSIFIPGINKWIEYNRLDPYPAMFLGMVSDLFNAYRSIEAESDDIKDILSGFVLAIATNTTNKTYMKSLNDFLEALQSGDTRYFENLTSSFLPGSSFISGLKTPKTILGVAPNPFYDPYLRETRGALDRYLSTFKDLPEQLDAFGKPIGAPQRFLGLKVGEGTDSPIRKELARLRMPFSAPPDYIGKVKLTPEQHHDYVKLLDERYHLENVLNKVVSQPGWESLPEDVRRTILRKMYNRYKAAAQHTFIGSSEEVQRATQEKLREKVEGLAKLGQEDLPAWLERVIN